MPGWVGLLVGLSCFSFHCAETSLRNPKAHVHMDSSWRDGFRGGREDGLRGWIAIPPREGGWLERRMKRRMEGSLRALGSHTYINVACQAYRATL